MKRFFYILFAALAVNLAGCTQSEVNVSSECQGEIDSLNQRIEAYEGLIKKSSTEVISIMETLDAISVAQVDLEEAQSKGNIERVQELAQEIEDKFTENQEKIKSLEEQQRKTAKKSKKLSAMLASVTKLLEAKQKELELANDKILELEENVVVLHKKVKEKDDEIGGLSKTNSDLNLKNQRILVEKQFNKAKALYDKAEAIEEAGLKLNKLVNGKKRRENLDKARIIYTQAVEEFRERPDGISDDVWNERAHEFKNYEAQATQKIENIVLEVK